MDINATATAGSDTTTEAVSEFPIEPIKLFGKKAYPLEVTEQYFLTLRTAYDSLQIEHTQNLAELKEAKIELSAERRSVAELKSELSEMKTKTEATTAEHEIALRRIAQLEKDVEQNNVLLEDRSKKLSQFKTELAEKGVAASRHASEIAALKKENAELNESASRSASLAELEELKLRFDAEIIVKDSIIAAKDAEIVENAEKLARKEAEIARLEECQYEILEGTEIMMTENNNSLVPAEFFSQIVDIWGIAQAAADDYVLQVKEHMDKRSAEAEQQASEMIASAQRERDEILQEAQEQAEALMSETTVDADAKRQKAEMVLKGAEEKAAEIVAAAETKAAEVKASANQELSTINQLIAVSSARYKDISEQKAQEFLG